MLRKLLGVVTAGVAGLLLVGVAWAAGDRSGDIFSDGSQVTAAGGSVASTDSSVVVSEPIGTLATSPSAAQLGSAGTGATSTSLGNGSSTSTSMAGTSSTSTTIDTTTSTTQAGSTSTTVDDNNREESRGPAPVNTAPTSYQVGAAGTVTVQITAGQLILLSASPAPGWDVEVDRADGERVEVEFENDGSDAEFEARVHNGELRVRVEAD